MTPTQSQTTPVSTISRRLPSCRSARKCWSEERFALAPLLGLLDVPTTVLAARARGADLVLIDQLQCAFSIGPAAARRRVARWVAVGLSVEEADAVASALGYHPSLVWPEWFATEGADWMDEPA